MVFARLSRYLAGVCEWWPPMKPIRLILAMPFCALAFSMLAVSIAVDLIGAAAVLMCKVLGGVE